MIPSQDKERSQRALSISVKPVTKAKKYEPKHYGPKPPRGYPRNAHERAKMIRKKVQKFLEHHMTGGETFQCPNFNPSRDDLIFRKQGESVFEWRIRQQDVVNFINEDWFGKRKSGDGKRRGAAAAFGVASKAKLRGTLLSELKTLLAHRKAMWEAHQVRCRCRKKGNVLEQERRMCPGEEGVKGKEERGEETNAMVIE